MHEIIQDGSEVAAAMLNEEVYKNRKIRRWRKGGGSEEEEEEPIATVDVGTGR
jgi:hypothetical protein